VREGEEEEARLYLVDCNCNAIIAYYVKRMSV
jgi:hypothetical protein